MPPFPPPRYLPVSGPFGAVVLPAVEERLLRVSQDVDVDGERLLVTAQATQQNGALLEKRCTTGEIKVIVGLARGGRRGYWRSLLTTE